MNWLNEFFGSIIKFFCDVCGNNFALGIMLFTIAINVVLIPLNIRQQKSTASQARLKNKLAKLQEKYKDDKAKYQEEMSKLYSQSGSSPLSGCLLMFIRLPIFIAIYNAVRRALVCIYGLDAGIVKSAMKALKLDYDSGNQLELLNQGTINKLLKLDPDKYSKIQEVFAENDFTLFGIDLIETPSLAIAPIVIIPLLSLLTSLASSLISNYNNKKMNGASSNAATGCMTFGMPLFSLFITFSVPGAVGWYWVCSNIVSTIIMVAMQRIYFPGKLIAQAEAKEARKRRKLEQARINPPATTKKDLLK